MYRHGKLSIFVNKLALSITGKQNMRIKYVTVGGARALFNELFGDFLLKCCLNSFKLMTEFSFFFFYGLASLRNTYTNF